MPRIESLADDQLSSEARSLLEHAEKNGSPDPRVLRILFRSRVGEAWYQYWRALTEQGELPADLKELCRVKIAFEHECGYCGTVRSQTAKQAGLTEEKIQEVWNYETSTMLSPREKAALRFADHLKHDIDKAANDAFYLQLREHFTESEIVELGLWCAENVGAGSFVKTLDIITWDEACQLNPLTATNAGRGQHVAAD